VAASGSASVMRALPIATACSLPRGWSARWSRTTGFVSVQVRVCTGASFAVDRVSTLVDDTVHDVFRGGACPVDLRVDVLSGELPLEGLVQFRWIDFEPAISDSLRFEELDTDLVRTQGCKPARRAEDGGL
jgi:hypothetical protein